MELLSPVLLAMGGVPFAAAVLVIWAGLARLRGRRSRFDRTAETFAAAAALSIYPPSLRGGGAVVPPPPDDEEPDRDRDS